MATESDPLEGLLLYGQPADEETIGGALTDGGRADPTATLCYYAVTPDPIPCSDGATKSTVTLMIAVANTSGEDQYFSQIVFRLPTEGRGALTTKPDAINPSPATGTDWSIVSDKLGTLTATPQSTDAFLAGDSIAFILTNVEVAEFPGAAKIDVEETVGGVLHGGWFAVKKAEPGLAITRLTATPIQVNSGEKTRLVWTTTGASDCSLTLGGRSHPVATNGSEDDTPQRTTTYALTASGRGTTVVQRVTVVVAGIRVREFLTNPKALPVGGKTTLSWNVENATSCTIEPEIGEVATVGSRELTLYESVTYTLTPHGPGAPVRPHQFMVTVEQPAEIVSFTATPSGPVDAGTPVTIAWEVHHVTRATIDQGIGSQAPRGSIVVRPQNDTTYTLTCTNLNGTKRVPLEIKIRDSVAILSFSVYENWEPPGPLKPPIFKGYACSWRVRNATHYAVSGGGPQGSLPGRGEWSGTGNMVVLFQPDPTYTLTCQGPNGPVSKEVKFGSS